MSLKDELLAAIENEENYFNMFGFCREFNDEVNRNFTCDTASCMAGWIMALRPEAEQAVNRYTALGCTAATIWKNEMGELCPLDFYGLRFRGSAGTGMNTNRSEITRADALAHIRGEHPHWPLLGVEVK